MDQIRDELDIVKQEVHQFHANSPVFAAEQSPTQDLCAEERKQALATLTDASRHGNWRWRTIERLTIISGITEKEALTVLRGDPDIELGKDKKGNNIAKFKHR